MSRLSTHQTETHTACVSSISSTSQCNVTLIITWCRSKELGVDLACVYMEFDKKHDTELEECMYAYGVTHTCRGRIQLHVTYMIIHNISWRHKSIKRYINATPFLLSLPLPILPSYT